MVTLVKYVKKKGVAPLRELLNSTKNALLVKLKLSLWPSSGRNGDCGGSPVCTIWPIWKTGFEAGLNCDESILHYTMQYVQSFLPKKYKTPNSSFRLLQISA